MNALRRISCRALAAFATASLFAFAPPAARAACTYYAIDTVATYATPASPFTIDLTQNQHVWSAMAVRPQAGEDWDVRLYRTSAPDPTCYANLLASSTAGGSIVDFVIGDYGFNPLGDYFAVFNQFSGAGAGYLRFTNSPQILTVNAQILTRAWAGLDMIETWNVNLVAGTTYAINFGVFGGAMDAKVMLFRNPAASTYWAGRSAAVLTSNTSTTYTAPATGTYAVVVVNDDGGSASFQLGIGTCVAPTALVSGTTQHTGLGYEYHQFTQSSAYWTAVGVRSPSDYDIGAYGGTAGPGFPNCLSDFKSSSTAVGKVDFVIGDFNYNPVGTYYTYTDDFSGAPGADIEWDSGANQLAINGAPAARTSDANDVLEVWDVLLAAGQTYYFSFNPSAPNLHMLLFRNPAPGAYWAGRGAAVFDVTGCWSYTAPASGYYGVVVVNDTGDHSTYTIGVSQAPCSCPVALTSNFPVSAPSPDAYYSFTQAASYWSVVATRGITNADDWDLTVAQDATGNAAPTCFGTPLIASSFGAGLVDVGVIDFNTTPKGTYFARTHHFSGAALAGDMEWDQTHGLLHHNDPVVSQGMSASDLAHSWDGYMVAGTSYTIEFTPSDPTIKLLVFENAGGGSYLVNRTGAALLTSSTIAYTPTATGYHGFVVVNDQAVNGSYTLRYGSCITPVALASGTAVPTPEGLDIYSFNQPGHQWAAVGVRAVTPADWDIRVSATQTSPFPTCIGGSLATSSSGALDFVDFVVGDFFHNAPATYYAEAKQFSGWPLTSTRVEWSSGLGEVIVNDNNATGGSTNASDLVRAWSVFLTAGTQYTFRFDQTLTARLHLLVYRNAGGGAYWTGRSGSEFDLVPGGGPFNYTAPSTGEYGIVVANDDGGNDSYAFNIKACTAPSALTSGVVDVMAPEGFRSFNQAVGFWTAVGVRSTSDWDIDVNSSGAGGGPGICQSGLLANSTGIGIVDFVVGDFNAGANPTGTYYTRPNRFTGSDVGNTEWDSGADAITIGAAPLHRVTGASDVLEIWDVFLTVGQMYQISFSHTGAADPRVLIFRNPGGVYWAPRSSNVYSNNAQGYYTAPATGWYGVVVVNDNGLAGDYWLGIYTGVLAVGDDAPGVTELKSVQPNPARAGTHIEYTLSRRAPVRLQLLDLAGRVVADMDDQTREAGVYRTQWNGQTRDGRKAAPGVYLVRFEVDGRAIGQRKLTLLQ